jgi:molybdenum cofactor guanylyltransferase
MKLRRRAMMLTGVILAGGKNKRMGGSPKAFLSFEGEQLIRRQIRTMKELCDEVIVVTNEPRPLLQLLGDCVRIITDFYPGKGPLSGMHAAFNLSTNEYVWVVGCDNPSISPAAASFMHRELVGSVRQAVIPMIHGHPWMLHAVYRKSCAEAAQRLLQQPSCKRSDLLASIDWAPMFEDEFERLGIPVNFTGDINTPEEYRQYQ